MPLLSTLLQFRVCDDSRRYTLDDIAIALLESDYPAVTHFVYRNSGHQHMMVPWHAVTGIERLPKARSAQLVELLRYPEATVGGIMTNDLVTLAFDQTIRDARLRLQERLKQKDFAHFVYVVESESSGVLWGTTSLQDLIVAGDQQHLPEITNVYVTTLDPLGSADAGAYRVLSGHLAALPVVGRDKKLLGIVTVDAAVMQVAPQSWAALAPKV
jgi:Mg/Co/Ni transporter MgtE